MNNKYSLPKDGGLIEVSAPRDIIHRYEKIHTTVYENEYLGVQYVADTIVKAIRTYNEIHCSNEVYEELQPFVLGLTTGRTPLGLVPRTGQTPRGGDRQLPQRGGIQPRRVLPDPLDRTAEPQFPHPRGFPQPHRHPARDIHIPDGTVPEARISEYCASYDHSVRKIDLMIIGVGEDGQIGFNEPGSYAKSRTRLVQLTHNTRKIQSGAFFGLENTPKMAITMGIDTIMRAEKIILMAWGEEKAKIVQKVVEGEVTSQVPASNLQVHPNIEVVIDENAAQMLTREQTPWLVGPCKWMPKFTRKAVVWLCGVVQKPILKLTYKDYIENSLASCSNRTRLRPDQHRRVQRPAAHHHGLAGRQAQRRRFDTPRTVGTVPQARGGILAPPRRRRHLNGRYLYPPRAAGHDVHVAYETSGNVAVHDDVVLQNIDTARELGFGDHYAEVEKIIAGKKKGEPEPRPLLDLKGAIRRAEARAAVRSFGLEPRHERPLPQPAVLRNGRYQEGTAYGEGHRHHRQAAARGETPPDLCRRRPGRPARDTPHGHGGRTRALDVVRDDEWLKECHLWLYRGAWMEWDLGMVDMAVPLSPDELIMKRHAIYRHLSQKDIMPFPGSDPREFWQRAEERTQNTAQLYDKLGMAEYQRSRCSSRCSDARPNEE